MIVVKNTNKEAFAKSWDSKPFVFSPGEDVTIPEGAAKYLFAYGMDEHERERTLARNGWLRNSSPDDDHGPVAARKFLAGFVFKKAVETTAVKAAPKAADATADDLPRARLHIPGSSKAIGPRLPPA